MTGALVSVIPKLERLIPLLSSDKDGEVVATARAIGRVLRTAGADWHDLAAAVAAPASRARPNPTRGRPWSWSRLGWDERLCFVTSLLSADWLSPWEVEFVTTIRLQLHARRGFTGSPKQVEVLNRLLAKAHEREGGE